MRIGRWGSRSRVWKQCILTHVPRLFGDEKSLSGYWGETIARP